MIRAAEVKIDINLQGFSQQLHRHGLAHRISEESGLQVLYVNSGDEAIQLRQALREWMQLPAGLRDSNGSDSAGDSSWSAARRSRWPYRISLALLASPVTWLLILGSGLVAVISRLGANLYPVQDLFYPLLPASGVLPLLAGIDSFGVLFRTLTPVFLHFGELHLVFNMLWLWYFGKQLEALQSGKLFLLLILFTAFISNTAQYLFQGSNNFGGMSGVVYGLVGYAWCIHYFMPRSRLMITNSMFIVFVIALIAMELVASSWIATTAHAAGLLIGLLIGLIVILINRLILGRESIGKQARPGN